MKISFADVTFPKAGAVVVGVEEERRLTASAKKLDEDSRGALSRAIKASRFTGKKDDALMVIAPAGLEVERVLLLGLGKPEQLDALRCQAMGGAVVAQLGQSGESEAMVVVDAPKNAKVGVSDMAANIAYGALLRSYRFDKYRTTLKPEQKPSLKKLTVGSADASAAKKAYQSLEKVADAVFFTRDLVSEPANVIYPESLAERAQQLAEIGVEVEVLDEKRMKKLGMGALLGVGQGSAHPPRLVVMQWKGNQRGGDQQPIAFIGKGVTFDTGGISIKPAQGMEEMKWDMAGAGVVIGLMRGLAARKARVNAVGIAGLVENMPSGTAQRPGDIVKSLSGQSIEVLNTDAEGRLVLADALWYCQDRFKPRLMIDLATLTGAIIISLGHEHAGLFSNNDELADRLIAAGKAVGEPLWRLPLSEAYDREIDCDVADVKNISGGRAAGSITAAQFLQRFVNNVPWAHLDIAGTAWSKKDSAVTPRGATAFGVRLLDRFVAEHYER